MQEILKSTIIDLSQCTDMTKAIVEYFVLSELNVSELDESVWSYALAHKWISLKIEDEINTRLEWAKNSRFSEELLNDTIVKFIKKHNDEELVDRFYEALDMADLYVSNIVQEVIGENNWRIWHTYFQADWVYFECDEDYRIAVFNEKVAAGEWEV